jgi:hypothetical protein
MAPWALGVVGRVLAIMLELRVELGWVMGDANPHVRFS